LAKLIIKYIIAISSQPKFKSVEIQTDTFIDKSVNLDLSIITQESDSKIRNENINASPEGKSIRNSKVGPIKALHFGNELVKAVPPPPGLNGPAPLS
jgi:hypothetical protein